MEVDETVEQAVARELTEETGLRAGSVRLLGVYSRPGRDPRGPTVSIAFRVQGKPKEPRAGSDAQDARWVPLQEAHSLAFDHDEIVADALSAVREKAPARRGRGPRK